MSNIGGVIKSIRDIFRKDPGLSGDAQRIEQLGWMIFLKLFDDKDKEREILDKKYKSPIPKDLQWRNWAENDEGITGDELIQFVNNKLFSQLKELPVTADNRLGVIIRNIFDGTNNYMKSGTTFRQAINKLNEIDFNSSKEHHIFNAIYEDILQGLATKKDTGEFYTPRAVTQFIIDMVNPKLGEKIIDPACGTAGFLVCAIEHLNKQVKNVADRKTLQETITGTELKPLPFMLSVINLITHDIEVPQIINADALSRELTSLRASEKVDIIVANPPFGGVVGDGMETNFPLNYRTKESADLFLIMFIQLLKEGGRAGIVLPDGSLTGEGVKQRVRQKLLEDCNVHTIIRLPQSVFAPYALVNTNLIFFEKGKKTKEVWFYEHKLPENYKAYSKTRPIRIEEFEPIKKWWNNRVESDIAWKVSIDSIIKNNYDLDIKNPTKKEIKILELNEALIYQKSTEDNFNSKFNEFIDGLRILNCKDEVEIISKHFKKVTNVTKAIPQLNSFILGLAFRGKLIMQNNNDEPVINLLSRISKSKIKLELKDIQLSPVRKSEIPFQIPSNWIWCRLGEVVHLIMGQSPEGNTYNKQGLGMPFYQGKTEFGEISPTGVNFWCTKPTRISIPNDILISVRAPVGDVNISDKEYAIGRGLSILRCVSDDLQFKYLFYYLDYFKRSWISKGSFFQAINKDHILMQLIPVPPKSEQIRIISEIEKQFAKTNELKEYILDNQQSAEQLLKALLNQPIKAEVSNT